MGIDRRMRLLLAVMRLVPDVTKEFLVDGSSLSDRSYSTLRSERWVHVDTVLALENCLQLSLKTGNKRYLLYNYEVLLCG